MQIILLEKIAKLGELGDTVTVKPGYARNYLLPQKKAVRATASAVEEVEKRKAQLIKEEKERLDVAEARAEKAIKMLTFTRSVIDSTGRLYGSVTNIDIIDAAAQAGTEILRSEIILNDGAIKSIGSFPVLVKIHPQVEFEITLEVVAENPEALEVEPAQSEEPAASHDDAVEDDAADSEAVEESAASK